MNKLNWKASTAKAISPYADYAIEILHTGSRVICDPAVTNTDDDWLFLCDPTTVKPFEEHLVKDGFKTGGSLDNRFVSFTKMGGRTYDIDKNGYAHKINSDKQTADQSDLIQWPSIEDYQSERGLFHSWKKDDLNIIITASPELFENFIKATWLSRKLNLLNKEDRITLFSAIKYDKWPEYNHLIYIRDSEGVMDI